MWGMAIAIPVAIAVPEFATVALAAGLLGGLVPDFDLYFGHRKTLHYPVWASLLSVPVLGLALVVPNALTIALAVGLAAAALHAVGDVFGGGLELRPWEGTSERAVYSHYHGEWWAPRRLVRYDGSPRDLLLASVPVLPLLAVSGEAFHPVIISLIVVSGIYVGLRRQLAELARFLVTQAPTSIVPYVPQRYLVD